MSSDPHGPGLDITNVTVGYGDVVAVDQVTFQVQPGEIIALLGPSGCGKSTLLRSIAGLEPIRTGSIAWQGVDLAGTPTHKRGVGMMFQHHALFPHRNVGDNIGFGLRMSGMAATDRRDRIADLLALVGLDGYGDRSIDTLSGGQAQRVALARALAPEPAVLLLDEPLGSLDRALRDRLVVEIRSIVRSVGTTAIHVTHDQDEAASVADRVALMHEGRLAAIGPIDTMRAHPSNAIVASFLGLETLWVHDGPGIETDTATAATPVGPWRPSNVPPVGSTLLLRPVHVRIDPDGPTPATVIHATHEHGAWLHRCRTQHGEIVASGAPSRLPEGSSVTLRCDLDEIEVLPAQD